MNIDLKLADIKDNYINLFNENREVIFNSSPDFINELRTQAIEDFEEKGFPVKKAEDYKYTNIKEVFSKELSHSFRPGKIEFEIEDLFSCDIPELDTRVLIVLNGFYYNPGQVLNVLENGIIFGSLSAASLQYPELFKKHYGKYALTKQNPIAALNTAFSQDGVFVYIPDNVRPEKPIQIINLLYSEKPMMVHHRNLFITGDNAEVNLVICDHTLSGFEFLTNSVTEVFAGKNSTVDITRVQNEHGGASQVTNSFVYQSAESNVRNNYITLHGGTVRNNMHVFLDGEHAENHSYGLFFADQDQHIDNYTYINHLKPNCMSNQLYKGILDNEAVGAFTGRIHVWPDAQKTMAYQKNNNILLSDTAKMYSKPQLEIYADDVKCSHGATVGQIDQDALFYLRSRGIPEKESRLLMLYAFAHEVVSAIKVPALKERIDELIDKRLRGELSRCNNCKMKCS